MALASPSPTLYLYQSIYYEISLYVTSLTLTQARPGRPELPLPSPGLGGIGRRAARGSEALASKPPGRAATVQRRHGNDTR